jgi:hypothetical protein
MANPKPDKIWSEAVHRAVKRVEKNGTGKSKRIEGLADKLVDFAMAGNGWAMQEIGNRLDGKPHQSSELNVDGNITVNVLARGNQSTE